MRIVCKCSLSEEQLKKTDNLCEFIELQLFNEFSNGATDYVINTLYERVISSLSNAKVVTVHAPITDGGTLCGSIEHTASEKLCDMVNGTVKLADMLGAYYGYKVNVVLHTELPYRYYDWFENIYEKIANTVETWMDTYPNIVLLVENIIPFMINKAGTDLMYHSNGAFDDNVKLVKKLREDIKDCRIYTLLDTAHALISLQAERNLFAAEDLPELPTTLEDYVKAYEDTLGYIHLADAIELGIKPNQHGICFSNHRNYVLTDFLELYKDYCLTCDVCLEVRENDYLKRENFKDDLLDVYVTCKKQGIPVENHIEL